MNELASDQIEELKPFCDLMAVTEEGGLVYIFLKNLSLPEGYSPTKIDALLCPMPRDGYESRLFFAERVNFPNFPNPNWNANGVRIAERNWHAISWKVPKANLRLSQILADHLNPHP